MSPIFRLGFIGLGFMGTAFTQRLLERGWPVTVWNREPERMSPLTSLGAKAAESPAAVTATSDLVLMCVLDAPAVEACVFGAKGVAQTARKGRVLVDHGTTDPAATRRMAARLQQETGVGWVDAPVSGGPEGARAGNLAIMAGGDAADIETIRPLMADLAATFTHMGPVGAGQTTKLINQALVGTGYVLMAEALALAEAAGIDAAALPACLAGGHADSALLRRLYPRMVARDFDPPKSYARQLLKDMKAVRTFARGFGLSLPVVESAVAQHETHGSRGNEFADSASIFRLYNRKP
jgi:3-hydroxyisobutyrate dehydrogenase